MNMRSMLHLNADAWGFQGIVDHYARSEGWLDCGEREAIERVADRCEHQPILDIGVGGGRTTALLRPLSEEYVGIDCSAAMIDACRRRFEHADLRLMDARHMEALPSNHFGLAFFSFNGIDAVDQHGREEIFHEVHRILKPGGIFIFSSFNRHGPWGRSRFGLFRPRGIQDVRVVVGNVKQSLGDLLTGFGRLRSYAAYETGDESRSIRLIPAFGFRILAMFTTPEAQLDELKCNGFEFEAIFSDTKMARPLENKPDYRSNWYYYVAHKLDDSVPVGNGSARLDA